MSEYEQYLVLKLLNSLKGSALSVKSANDTMMTPQQRLEAMKAIEKLKVYVESYEHYVRNLKDTQDVIK